MAIYLITGASSGIGAALSKQAISRGHTVYGVARRKDVLDTQANELGERFVPFVCDVTDKDAVNAVCAALPALPDVLILNAGIGLFDNKQRFDLDLHRRTFELNYFGVMYFIDALFEPMVARGHGHIAATSSLAAYRGLPMAAAYSASKAALTNSMEGLRLTYGRLGLSFSVIQPGFVKTPMTEVNKGGMPFLWPADKAANHILNKLEKRCKNITFPLPLRLGSALIRLLPAWLHYKLMAVKGKRKV